ncbi:MAG: hypothetical protein A4E57_02685 [Syntrophorhabdaceae bacterium PtaU1.Bin034]|nr:MAG: hypothetical protein A4E57_02685 [Syntrophorhabdaceae bacterium PtaU1.Bin034]
MAKMKYYPVLVLIFIFCMLSAVSCGTASQQRSPSDQHEEQYIPPRPYTAA